MDFLSNNPVSHFLDMLIYSDHFSILPQPPTPGPHCRLCPHMILFHKKLSVPTSHSLTSITACISLSISLAFQSFNFPAWSNTCTGCMQLSIFCDGTVRQLQKNTVLNIVINVSSVINVNFSPHASIQSYLGFSCQLTFFFIIL